MTFVPPSPPGSQAGRGHVYLLVGPSGGGKTTLARAVTGSGGDGGFQFVASTTSRPPRPGEQEGADYHFTSEEEFTHCIAEGGFLEWQSVHGFRYGSSRRRLETVVSAGRSGITSADILGAFKIKAAMPTDVTTVFVTPSDANGLRQRILARAPLPGAELQRRLDRVAMEMRLAHACDHLILNDDLDAALASLRRLATAQACQAVRLRHFNRRPVVRMVQLEPPPAPEFGSRFCVADCETPEEAVERVLHQWWWERHPEAVRFALPPWVVGPAGPPRLIETPQAVLELSVWTARLPDGRAYGPALA